jgi:hypothetical protein
MRHNLLSLPLRLCPMHTSQFSTHPHPPPPPTPDTTPICHCHFPSLIPHPSTTPIHLNPPFPHLSRLLLPILRPLLPVMRIRDVYPGSQIPDPGSDFLSSRIPDPNCFHPGSRIRIKKFKYFNPNVWGSKLWEYDPSSSSRIRILTIYPSRIPDPGVKKAPVPGTATLPPPSLSPPLSLVSTFQLPPAPPRPPPQPP